MISWRGYEGRDAEENVEIHSMIGVKWCASRLQESPVIHKVYTWTPQVDKSIIKHSGRVHSPQHFLFPLHMICYS